MAQLRPSNLRAGTISHWQRRPSTSRSAPRRRFAPRVDCKVILAMENHGTLADVRPGDRVTVVYELPDGSRVAFRIRERESVSWGRWTRLICRLAR